MQHRSNQFALLIHAVLIVSCLVMVYQFVMMVFNAFKSTAEIYTNPYGLPYTWTINNFVDSWKEAQLGRLFVNSAFLTSLSLTVCILLASLAAYAFARSEGRLQSYVYLFFVSGIFVPFQLSIIPLFKIIADFHLFNSYLGVLVVYVAGGIPLGVFLMTSFMKGLPKELAEAGLIDGCGFFRMYFRIHLPLIAPVVATYAILQGLAVWNDFLIPMLLLTDESKRTLTTGIMSFKQQYVANWGYMMAGILMMVTPILIFYILLQKYIMNGITQGAIKG